jgi:hypothetical protein
MPGTASRSEQIHYSEARYEHELRLSYRKVAESTSRPIMADALAAAFYSSDLGFPHLLADLFEHCNEDQRGKLLGILVRSLGASSRNEVLGETLAAMLGERNQYFCDISPGAVRRLAAQAARSDPAVIEHVADFYSRVPNITKYLPTPTIAAVLTYIARNSYGDGPA